MRNFRHANMYYLTGVTGENRDFLVEFRKMQERKKIAKEKLEDILFVWLRINLKTHHNHSNINEAKFG